MKKTLVFAAVSVLVSVFSFMSCKKDDNNTVAEPGLDRAPMLTNYADNYIIPAYAAMVKDLKGLKAKTDAFVANPDAATLSELKSSFEAAYITWQKTDVLEFGPAEDVSLRMYMNTYPVTITKVNGNITNGGYDLEQFGNKDAQGFPAIDYLLNGNANTIELFTTDAQSAARKQYLQAVVNKMLQKTEGVSNTWASYRNTFVAATGTDVNGGLSKMVNAYVLYFERYLRSGKVGLPVGAMTGVAKPELTEAYYTPQLSNVLSQYAMAAAIAFYEGKNYDGTGSGASMKTYLASIGTKDDNGTAMADLITTKLKQAETRLKALNTPIKDAVISKRPEVLTIYDDMQQCVPLLKVDMVSAFGISITYTDNDGD
ncbi:MAG: imelysin family protein [Flavipsychrobacter sp.]